ncbi:MAG: TetR family transcriptional regulator [Bifidobacteriaceae bacterium]|nr:TetR family transcriptional regulator [Bifidobacteriaceae bacterium]
MRSTTDAGADLTAKARIRDAAIELFAREGFGVPVRRLAEAAGVSPGLVIHHFGSKEGLKQDCDRQVSQVMLELRSATAAAPPTAAEANLIYQLANVESYSYLLGYLLHSLRAGGAAARAFIATMVEATAELLARGVAAGTIRPSRDPAAQARFLAYSAIGSLLVWHGATPPTPVSGALPASSSYVADFGLPSLELYTEGILTTSALLDAYLAHTPTKETNDDRDTASHRHHRPE